MTAMTLGTYEFNDAIPLDSIYTKYILRPQKLNASYQYSFNDSRGGDCSCAESRC
jgi:hypothetical protein